MYIQIEKNYSLNSNKRSYKFIEYIYEGMCKAYINKRRMCLHANFVTCMYVSFDFNFLFILLYLNIGKIFSKACSKFFIYATVSIY